MMRIYFLLLLLLICGYCPDSLAQCTKDRANSHKQAIPGTKSYENTSTRRLACKLTSSELRKRKEEVIATLKAQTLEKKELPNGYAYKFGDADETLGALMDFIISERKCCDFFDFKLVISGDPFAWLEITGPEGAKQFIGTELEL